MKGLAAAGTVEAAGTQQEVDMDAAKAESILTGHMSAVRKVYGAVPMREPWPFSKIHNELIRTGVRQDRHKLEGCVRQLVDSGLVRRVDNDHFIRTPIARKEKPVKKETPTPTEVEKAPTLLEIAGALATRLRSAADEIDGLALAYEEQLKKCGSDSEKLKQLQALLKGIA